MLQEAGGREITDDGQYCCYCTCWGDNPWGLEKRVAVSVVGKRPPRGTGRRLTKGPRPGGATGGPALVWRMCQAKDGPIRIQAVMMSSWAPGFPGGGANGDPGFRRRPNKWHLRRALGFF